MSEINPLKMAGGQALVETLVIATVLVPLLLVVALLGKYQSVQMASIAAARTLVFECTVRSDECRSGVGLQKLQEEIIQRHLSRTSREIFSLDRVVDSDMGTERHALWTNRKGESLLESFGSAPVSVTEGRFDAGAGVAEGFEKTGRFKDAVSLLSNLAGPGRFGLDIRAGLLTATVQTKLGERRSAFRSDKDWLDGLPLSFRYQAAILVDDWSASKPAGPESSTVESRVTKGRSIGTAVEASTDLAYAAVRASIAILAALGLEKTGSTFRYRDIDTDVIPPDRRGEPDSTQTSSAFEGG